MIGPALRRGLRALAAWLVVGLITLGAIEIGLRLFPQIIPLDVLMNFDAAPRAEVAQRLGLPNKLSMQELARDDGGPPLMVYKPFAHVALRKSGPENPVPVDLDRNGLCNPDDRINDLPTVDIVAIGDSFTFCIGVQASNTWPALLAGLAHRTVLNLGVPGIGIYEELQVLRARGLPRRPKLVILNFYEGNDLRDAWRYHDFRAKQSQGGSSTGRRHNPGDWLSRHSYALNLISATVSSVRDSLKSAHRERRDIDFRYDAVFPEATVSFNVDNGDTDEVVTARKLNSGQGSADAVDDGLSRFAELAKDAGFQPIVTYSPTAYTAYQPFIRFKDPSLQSVMQTYSQHMREHLQAACARLGVRFVDFTPALQAAAVAQRSAVQLYGFGYRHLTREGNMVLATELAKVIAGDP